jgi:arsenate reductase-like glutaredoxin family protein
VETEIQPIPHYKELSAGERRNLWFSPDEVEEMRANLFQSIDKLEVNEPFDGSSDTARGLEFYTYSASLDKQCRKLQLIRSILQEQDRQRQMGDYNESKLARISLEHGANSMEFARYIALQDACNAYNEDQEYDDDDEYELDKILQQNEYSLRPVLMLCCWPFGLSSLKHNRDD